MCKIKFRNIYLLQENIKFPLTLNHYYVKLLILAYYTIVHSMCWHCISIVLLALILQSSVDCIFILLIKIPAFLGAMSRQHVCQTYQNCFRIKTIWVNVVRNTKRHKPPSISFILKLIPLHKIEKQK